MAKGKNKIITKRNQSNMSPLERSSFTAANPRHPITSEKQELDLKSHLMMLTEDFKKDINNSLKEIQENMSQQEALKKGNTKIP